MWFYECTWKITNGYMVATVKDVLSNTNHEAAGAIDRMKIISLNATNLVWQMQISYKSNNVVRQEGYNASLQRVK